MTAPFLHTSRYRQKALCNPLAVSLGRTKKRTEGDGEGVKEGVPLIISELEAEGAKEICCGDLWGIPR